MGETCITWFGNVYAFHKPLLGLLRINCPKPGSCSKIENILYLHVFKYYSSINVHTCSTAFMPSFLFHIQINSTILTYITYLQTILSTFTTTNRNAFLTYKYTKYIQSSVHQIIQLIQLDENTGGEVTRVVNYNYR